MKEQGYMIVNMRHINVKQLYVSNLDIVNNCCKCKVVLEVLLLCAVFQMQHAGTWEVSEGFSVCSKCI